MKKLFFLGVALCMFGAAMAEQRIYLMGDERAITDPSWETQMPDEVNSTMFLWIRDWGDQSLTCDLNMSGDAGPSGAPYYIFTPHADNAGNVGGYYGMGYVSLKDLDMSQITEDWYLNIVIKTNCPFVQFTFGDGTNEAMVMAHEMLKPEEKDNAHWVTLSIPFYDLTDQNLDWSKAIPSGKQWFSLLTNENTAAVEQVCIDVIYFTDGNTTPLNEVHTTAAKAVKYLKNGQLMIKRNNMRYNVLGKQL